MRSVLPCPVDGAGVTAPSDHTRKTHYDFIPDHTVPYGTREGTPDDLMFYADRRLTYGYVVLPYGREATGPWTASAPVRHGTVDPTSFVGNNQTVGECEPTNELYPQLSPV